ncbi:hypothetical protein E4M02_02615 [Brevundimonas sp. S30B]|uniref:hypothetical protein n=1 Tax=unclassified Brevundimonas TaxID=2622653 RepID=UPI0010722A54|nr:MULTISPECIES: hypothetical protein [unclassified Brevundimonas]QBX37217.1 hypothetical protein E4M01_05205 [Brevundimonas sp. MF30-B]TFW03989.1 hypothetical protein E4M02_02615 [Brevundimonas sp. S30B]
MPHILPSSPGPSSMTPRPIFARNETRPAYGGSVGRNLRPGTRWAWDIDMPAMTYVQALAFDDILSEDETVVIDILQPGLVIGNPGAPQINGGSQLGRTLNLKGLTPGYVLRKGQWLSFQVSAQWFAYKTSAAATADGSGNVAVPLRTMIRVPPANNAAVAIAAPKAEGWATVDPESLRVGVDQLVWLRFTVEERE